MLFVNALRGSVRRECLDHFFIFHEKQLDRLLRSSVLSFHQARPHQGLGQRLPDPPRHATPPPTQPNHVIALPAVGGLHHDDQSIAEAWERERRKGKEIISAEDDSYVKLRAHLPFSACFLLTNEKIRHLFPGYQGISMHVHETLACPVLTFLGRCISS